MSEHLRLSTCSYYIKEESGDTLFYSSLTGKIIRVGRAYQSELDTILTNKTSYNFSTLCGALIDAKILVPTNFNEDEYISTLREKAINCDDTLDLTIFPSEACNLRCKYCWESFTKGNMSHDTETAIIRYLKKHIPAYKRLNIKWFGGEPLLNVSAIERIMDASIVLCREHGVILTASITTNGYLLTPEMVSKLMKHKIYEFQVTLDGLKQYHDKMRVLCNGQGTFDKIIDNLIQIKETITNRLLRVLIRTNFSYENIASIDEYASFYMQTFGNDKRFSAYWNAVQDWGGDAVLNLTDKLILNYDKTQVNLIAEKYNIPLVIESQLLAPGGYACYAGKKNSFIIGSDGNIYKCPQRIYDEYDQIGHLTSDGDMILSNAKYNRWIEPFVEEKCYTCVLRASCLSARCPKRRFTNQPCTFSVDQLTRSLQSFANNKYNYIEFI